MPRRAANTTPTEPTLETLDAQPEAAAPAKAPRKPRATKPIPEGEAVKKLDAMLGLAQETILGLAPPQYQLIKLDDEELHMEAEALAKFDYIRTMLATVGNPWVNLIVVNVVICGRKVKMIRELAEAAKAMGYDPAQMAQAAASAA